ncbi:Myb/SANT-like DNA-binding domain [Popillia japonica]|uniref:Regulatory protein zeste n=1 Tax=Popillia japonica TaxID=7064 RepID=A0AAW1JXC7_POPJA
MEKRDRCANFTETDRELLMTIVAQYFDSIENKKTDGATIKQKNQAWEQVAETFNAATVNGGRTWQQLKNSYHNIKRKLKKENADEKVEIYKTGGGKPCTPKLSDTKIRLLSLLKPQIEPLVNEFDSSADFFADTTYSVINVEESSNTEHGTVTNFPVETTSASVEITMATPSTSIAGSSRHEEKQAPKKKEN